jgi:DNA-binding CsgD family transcriptional regulator
VAHFAAARANGELDRLPLYNAHLLTDYAVAGHQLGRPDLARQLSSAARSIYTGLDATPYMVRLDALDRANAQAGAAPGGAPRRLKVQFELTDREQDVLTLVTSGMSYAQISRELFITQSTVSYHLSNIYDKTGIRRRAQLTELFRREPHAFGVTASA